MAKTITLRLEDKPATGKKLDALMKKKNVKTYQSMVEIIIDDYEQQDKTIMQLREKIIQLQDELELKNGIIHDVKRFISIPERLAALEAPKPKKKAKPGILALIED